ncbi:hypothetical protein DAPPUDRAFT_326562 [Daphnia pulex]|uniref:Uncharacterized protein n=1 Tax=Daphnia pulex TaxID=6669 RepID=E9H844_DAPPU|nr:hypothetical protein DAPPUDRAFT_326562 [Daphnia pulex]|eukprot:EFX72006.1 hypothetical protein DAPPUDRAFT_326562 [Daphnia pulex]
MEVATARVNLVKFIQLMKAEAEKIDWKAKLLSQEQQLQSISKDSTHFNAKLMELWKKFQDKALSSKELLGELAKLSRKQESRNKRVVLTFLKTGDGEAAIIEKYIKVPQINVEPSRTSRPILTKIVRVLYGVGFQMFPQCSHTGRRIFRVEDRV